MVDSHVTSIPIQEWPGWKKSISKDSLLSFDLELTARCNFNCRHCYIRPDGDAARPSRPELSFEEIRKIVDEAVSLGAMWCLLTGGEPLLRKDFFDIYRYLKQKGLLISVFTNGALITEDHIELFRRLPPRNIEITIYGMSESTYRQVTQKADAFQDVMRAIDQLQQAGVKVRLKSVIMKSNIAEFHEISEFCRKRTCDYYRFDAALIARVDMNQKRNQMIFAERLDPSQIVSIEKADKERFDCLLESCDKMLIPPDAEFRDEDNLLFKCGTGLGHFSISHDGFFLLCSSLRHPDCIYDLRKGALPDALTRFTPEVRAMTADNPEFHKKCKVCHIINYCMWCPANAYLETGQLDAPIEYFCEVAHERTKSLGINSKPLNA